ncbi:unnamed protein product [Prorocentrum cordatum]|uniref:DEK-C domain-containing protein n=1 Tax=Prorocentrum cordatum TaxID=2364126 RepID=A0ABN9VMT1_9DINO|nr:unnamed protein product [Polarella glacialis]
MAAPIDVDVVDLSDEEEGPPKPPAPPTAQALRSAVIAELEGRDLASVSLKTLRRSLEARFGLVVGAFDARRDEIKATAQETVGGRGRPGAAGSRERHGG